MTAPVLFGLAFLMHQPMSMRCRVLTVDDRPDNLLALRAVLGDTYDVLEAHSGLEALALLAKEIVDIILLDIEMPGLDGYETTRQIKTIPTTRDIPVILISGVFTEDPYVKKGYESGAVDYFTKPFDMHVFRTKIGMYASLRQKDMVIREQGEKIQALESALHTAGLAAPVHAASRGYT